MKLVIIDGQAAEGGFDSFTSSLFISPYQNHELMREVAERAAAEYGVEFLYRDFRPYFRAGQERARELGFYIQKYCGCVFSEVTSLISFLFAAIDKFVVIRLVCGNKILVIGELRVLEPSRLQLSFIFCLF